ncbi:MAG: prolipoprotein diacylglyceryl transferase [Gammaproteobacteria bacterium]
MLNYPSFDPVAFRWGALQVHWYGIMYLIGFGAAWLLGHYRIKKQSANLWKAAMMDDLLFYGAIGVVLGGRLGYVLFYDLVFYWQHPQTILYIWQGGMSFHGGLVGVLVALAIFAKQKHLSYWVVSDFVAPLVPIGLGVGRLGNFINGELWGKVSSVPWAMVFPQGGPLPRHPSQLYEALLEGVVLFLIIWCYTAKPKPVGAASGLFLICYGIFRCFSEFFRQPDIQWGYLAWHWVTMGQLLSIPMVFLGVFLWVKSTKYPISYL